MNDKYTSLFDKLQVTDEFKKDTVQKMLAVKKEKKGTETGMRPKRKIVWRVIPAAASLLIVAIIIGLLFLPGGNSGNSFTLVASAASAGSAELNQNSFVPIFSGTRQSYGSSTDDEKRLMLSEASINLKVEGNNIEKITYTVENGALTVPNISRKVLTESEIAKDFPDWGYDKEHDTFYRSLSVAFDNQPKYDDRVRLTAIKNFTESEDRINKRYLEILNTHEPISKEEYQEVLYDYYNLAFSDVKMTATVAYSDGSSDSVSMIFSVDVTVNSVAYDSELRFNHALADIVLMAKLV